MNKYIFVVVRSKVSNMQTKKKIHVWADLDPPPPLPPYDKRDDFDFDIVNFPFLDGDVPRSTSYGVYIFQLIRFARVSSHVADFNARNKSLTAKLPQ